MTSVQAKRYAMEMTAVIVALFLLLTSPTFAMPPKCDTCPRDSRGHIKRSHAPKREFRQANPCPSTGKTTGKCSGYVIDHIVPLGRGGPDAPSNMQWQTIEEGKMKDKWE